MGKQSQFADKYQVSANMFQSILYKLAGTSGGNVPLTPWQ